MNKLLPKSITSLVAGATLFAIAAGAQAQPATGDAKAGESKAAMCIGCHGIVGYQNSFPEIHKVPKIAGQSAGYIVSALTAYKKGDRKHPTMRGMAGSLTEQDMADLGAFYSTLAGAVSAPEGLSKPASPAVAALLEKGACVSCHGANLSKPIDASYPKVAGQHADYAYVALKSYTVEGNSVIGRNHAVMGGVAKQFTLAELKQLATYLGSLDGELKTVPQAKFR